MEIQPSQIVPNEYKEKLSYIGKDKEFYIFHLSDHEIKIHISANEHTGAEKNKELIDKIKKKLKKIIDNIYGSGGIDPGSRIVIYFDFDGI
tara:strand:- start:1028 stop:1300 length:273 start_codon:yes stop_codon:yes gene_type:complete